MKPIALIGLRGSGKTSVGRELARAVGGSFMDTDDLVAQAAGKSIADIFAQSGEAEFRRLERQAVGDAVAASPAVLSLGGGAVLDPENAAAVRSTAAVVVWLTAPPEVLVGRMQADPRSAASRPPLTTNDSLNEMRQLLRDRGPVYAGLADHVVDTAGRNVLEVVSAILKEVGRRF